MQTCLTIIKFKTQPNGQSLLALRNGNVQVCWFVGAPICCFKQWEVFIRINIVNVNKHFHDNETFVHIIYYLVSLGCASAFQCFVLVILISSKNKFNYIIEKFLIKNFLISKLLCCSIKSPMIQLRGLFSQIGFFTSNNVSQVKFRLFYAIRIYYYDYDDLKPDNLLYQWFTCFINFFVLFNSKSLSL